MLGPLESPRPTRQAVSTAPTADDLAELHALETVIGADSLLEFVPRTTPRWVAPWHLAPIAKLFAKAEYGPIRACVSVPPRHGKTELLLHAMCWWLSRHLTHHVGYVSYAGELAASKSSRAMGLARSAGLPISPTVARANEWQLGLGNESGGVFATGIGGPLTGHGVDILLVDDPVKNREEAESAAARQRVWEWFTSTGLTRIEPGGSCIVVHTRWHVDDLIGRLLRGDAGDGWEHVNLEAIDDDDEALWPERWPSDVLATKRSEVGEYDWWSLYMGTPRPRGGRLFREPTFYGRFPDIDGSQLLISCDPAATSKTHADYSAIIVGAGKLGERDGLPHVDILEAHRLQVEIPILVGYLIEVQKKWGCRVAIESVGGFKAVPQTMRALNKKLRITEVSATADKFTRALPAAAAWNDGRIRLPIDAPWMPALLDETSTFTGIADSHDDQVDALAHLYNAFDHALRPRKRGENSVARWLPFG